MSGGKLAAHPRIPGTTAIGPTEQLIGKRNDDVFHRYPVAPFRRNTVDPVLAYMSFPGEHWRQLHSTNPLLALF